MAATSPSSEYLLANQATQAGARFEALAAAFNPWTFGAVGGDRSSPGGASDRGSWPLQMDW